MKRLIICCDGTWQSLDNDWPTNVQRIAQFVLPTAPDGITQTLYYDEGVGLKGTLDKIAGGALGDGLNREIEEAYSFLALNYEIGDEIYFFGFSRGAYTVRSLAGLIRSCGIVRRNRLRAIPRAMALYRDREIKPDHDECVVFRKSNSISTDDSPPIIHFLGCYDTVGSLGIPDDLSLLPVDTFRNAKFQFHDTQLNSFTRHARHAVAIDEKRKDFDVTRMQPPGRPLPDHTLVERWFPGTHSIVGGGLRQYRGLSDTVLLWMVQEAKTAGLEFEDDLIEEFTRPDPLQTFDDDPGAFGLLRPTIVRDGPTDRACLSDEAMLRWHELGYCPPSIKAILPDSTG